jgi:hypothetical protein
VCASRQSRSKGAANSHLNIRIPESLLHAITQDQEITDGLVGLSQLRRVTLKNTGDDRRVGKFDENC